MAQELWERLRTTGLQDLAPVLFEHGVRELRDILPNAGPLLLSGVESWKLEAVVRGRLEASVALPSCRPDHPVAEVRQRASWAAALEAQPPGLPGRCRRCWRPRPGPRWRAGCAHGGSSVQRGSDHPSQSARSSSGVWAPACGQVAITHASCTLRRRLRISCGLWRCRLGRRLGSSSGTRSGLSKGASDRRASRTPLTSNSCDAWSGWKRRSELLMSETWLQRLTCALYARGICYGR